MQNHLYYGDNLDVLRKYVPDESVDLCYIDPPFNSKRNYNQIYTNKGKEDLAQAQAFVDTWVWDELAIKGFSEIVSNENGVFTDQCIKLMIGLKTVLGEGNLFAYLVSIALRCAEIFRVLKPTGSFYFHCDPTSSHYIKLVLDAIFCAQGGDYRSEITWKRSSAHSDTKQGRKAYGNIGDIIFYYVKSKQYCFNTQYTPYDKEYIAKTYKHKDPDGRLWKSSDLTGPGGAAKGNPSYEFLGVTRYWRYSEKNMYSLLQDGRIHQSRKGAVPRMKHYLDEMPGVPIQSIWTDIPPLSSHAKERLGYPTQKPEQLLERIIETSSNQGDVVLDAYCGCGTTVAVAQKLNRKWIGIDITYQAISLILKRLEDAYGTEAIELDSLKVAGIPRDLQSATALATRKDDRTRKEFEKWAVLTYTRNRAIINQKKGADKGIDGTVFFLKEQGHGRIIFQVKSGKVQSRDIRDLQGTMTREKADAGIFITLKPPSKAMLKEVKAAGIFHHKAMNKDYPCIEIVTVDDILNGNRIDIPLSLEVLRSAERKQKSGKQLSVFPGVAAG